MTRKGISNEPYSRMKTAALKNKTIQKFEKQKQYISENGENLKKQKLKNKIRGKKWRNSAVNKFEIN